MKSTLIKIRTWILLKKMLLICTVLFTLLFVGCNDFFDPVQDLVVNKEAFFADWEDYRAAEMGLYALQQKLVEQIVVLGELRADLLEITPNADKDLVEVYNFQISKDNKYASPSNFYLLIGACNSLAYQLETEYPEVLDENAVISKFDRLYGEVICMRAWAYFNAVKIYGQVPYIWPSLTSVEEINEYVNSSGEYRDTIDIVFDPGGYYNDTLRYDTAYILDRKFLDIGEVIDTMTYQLNNKIKAIGVLHNIENEDVTWEATIWSEYAMYCLLGQMYLYQGNLHRAEENFYHIMYYSDPEDLGFRFGLDNRFKNNSWKNIFSGIDVNEHILTVWFNKSYRQQNDLQKLFSVVFPNKYMLKPTSTAITNWEGEWNGMELDINNSNPSQTRIVEAGEPGDFYRGHGVSFAYIKNNEILDEELVKEMLNEKRLGNTKNVETILEDTETVAYKYTIGKNNFDQDANFIIYRAAAVHLYYAEIFNRMQFYDGGLVRTDINLALNILNDGSYRNEEIQEGVRGRVGFGDGDDAIYVGNIVYEHDPATNLIVGYKELNGLLEKQEYIEDQILNERARELAYEGERFYDLIRIAKRRNDPSYLADIVAAKFPEGKREAIRIHLMDENNWYIPFY
jgi:starch-binding outer membrane protein, SusD/RagB family